MAAVMREVVVGIVTVVPTVTVTVRAAVPAVGAAVTATAVHSSSPGAPLAGSPTTQAGQRLRDGFGGIRCGVVRFGGHRSILHAT